MTSPQPSIPRQGRLWLLTVFVIVANVVGNLALSWGMKHPLALRFTGIPWIDGLFSPWVLLGVLLLALWTASRIQLLSWADLSFVLPVTSVGYVLNAVLGYWVYGEQISAARWAGTGLILLGSALTGFTPPKDNSV